MMSSRISRRDTGATDLVSELRLRESDLTIRLTGDAQSSGAVRISGHAAVAGTFGEKLRAQIRAQRIENPGGASLSMTVEPGTTLYETDRGAFFIFEPTRNDWIQMPRPDPAAIGKPRPVPAALPAGLLAVALLGAAAIYWGGE